MVDSVKKQYQPITIDNLTVVHRAAKDPCETGLVWVPVGPTKYAYCSTCCTSPPAADMGVLDG